MAADAPTLWLVGMMGAGKTGVGKTLAARTGSPFWDTDAEIVADMGCGIPEIFERIGEGAFRDMEARQIARLAGRRGIVATGGGAVLRADNVARMRASGTVVWLDAEPHVLANRIGEGASRPLMAGHPSAEDRLAGILDERRTHYDEAAHHRVDVSDRDLDAIADEVEALWNAS